MRNLFPLVLMVLLVSASAAVLADEEEFAENPKSTRTAFTAYATLWSPAVDWECDVTAGAGTSRFRADNAIGNDNSWRPGLGIAVTRIWSSGYRLRLGYQFTARSSWEGPVHWYDGLTAVYTNDKRGEMEYKIHTLHVAFMNYIGSLLDDRLTCYLGAGASGTILRFSNDDHPRPPYAGSLEAGEVLTVTWANDTNVGFVVYPVVGIETQLEKGLGLFLEASFQYGRTFEDTDAASHRLTSGDTASLERSGHFETLGPSLILGFNILL